MSIAAQTAPALPRDGLVGRRRRRAAHRREVLRSRGGPPPARRGHRRLGRHGCLPLVRTQAVPRLRDRPPDLRRHRCHGRQGRPVDGLDHDLLHGAQLAVDHVLRGAPERDLQCAAVHPRSRHGEPVGVATLQEKGTYLLNGMWKFGTGNKLQSQRVPAQVRMANLLVQIEEAEVLMRDVAARMQRHADGEATLSFREQNQLRLRIAHVVRHCRDIVRAGMEASGASAHYLDHELQRLHRDIHMICAHTVFDVDLLAEGVGKALVKEKSTHE